MTNLITYLFLMAVLPGVNSGLNRIQFENIPPVSGVVMFAPTQDAIWGPLRDRVGTNLLLSDDDHHRPQNETSVAVNPSDPDHILGGCNDYRAGDASAGFFVSFDGGQSWYDELIPGLDDFDAAGNPSVAIGRDGRAWFCGIHFNRENDRGGIFISRSDDGGLNWEDPSYLIVHPDEQNPPFEDKPYICIDNTGSQFDGQLYVSWTRFGTGQIYFSRSDSDGEDWSEPLLLYEGRGQGSIPVVATDGGLFVIWKDYTQDRMIGRYSDDGGVSFGDIFVAAETDGLPYYLEPYDLRVNSIPSIAVDLSEGEHRDRIYVTWADDRSGDADILLVWSDDGAENWTDPIRLNDDEFENGIDQFFPWIAVDPITGILFGVWYDRRLDEDNVFIDMYGIRWDGSGDLPANERITSESSDPWIGGFHGRFMGDNIGIAAIAGRAHPAWCDTRTGNQDIFGAVFEGERHFTVIAGNQEHILSIEELTIEGHPPEAGDEIAVIDSDGWVVGMTVIEDEEAVELTVTGAWARPRGFGFYQWAVWDESEQTELVGASWILEGDELLQDDGFTSLILTAPPPDVQNVELDHNWNMVSVGLYPVNLDICRLFQPVQEDIKKISDQDGNFFVPYIGFTNMLPFDPLQGYLVGIEAEQLTWSVSGVRIDPQCPIPLREGWNMTAYLPDYPLDPWTGFDNIIDDLILGKNDMGEFMVPERGFSNIYSLEPGEAYQLKLAGTTDLVYPEQDEEFIALSRLRHGNPPQYFQSPRITLGSMSILIQEIAGASQITDRFSEVAALNQDGRVIGITRTYTPPPWGMAVWMDDPLTSKVDGFVNGEKLEFRAWSRVENREYHLVPEIVEGDESFVVDGFSVVALSVSGNTEQHPGVFGIDKIHPNPINSSATVSFRLSETGTISLKLYNLEGRLIREIINEEMVPGMHAARLPCRTLPSGMYILVLRSKEQTDMRKMTVIR